MRDTSAADNPVMPTPTRFRRKPALCSAKYLLTQDGCDLTLSVTLGKETRKEGRTEGRKEGRTEGRTDGRKEGRKEGRV